MGMSTFIVFSFLLAFGIALIVTALAAGRDALSKSHIRLIGVAGTAGIVILMIVVGSLLPTFSPLWTVLLAAFTFGLILRHIGHG
jgi:hypothetical protein